MDGALLAASSPSSSAAVVHKSLNADSHKDGANNVLNGKTPSKIIADVFTNS